MENLRGLKTVFVDWRYSLLVVVIATIVFVVAVWIPNTRLIVHVIPDHTISIADKADLLVSLLGSIMTNFTVVSASYTIAIAILFGINISLLVYYVRARRNDFKGSGAAVGLGGLISGIFGIGCAACGSFILTSVLALVGAGGALAFLPFGGEEFGFIGVALLGYAVYWTAKRIQEPAVCVTD